MKKLHLLSTAAAALLLAAGTAAAQNAQPSMPERAPAAQRHAPAEKIAPPIHAGTKSRAGAETTGQGGHELQMKERDKSDMNAGGHDRPGAKSESGTTGQGSGKSDKNDMSERKGASHEEMQRSSQSGHAAGAKEKDESKSSADVKSKQSTTGQGAAAGSARLTTQQRSKITAIIRQHKVRPTHLNISVHVGARVPASVHFYALPVEVVEVYPEWRGYDYIMVGDQILVLDPDDHEIVAVLET